MREIKQKAYNTDSFLAEFFAQDDLKSLAADAGALLECPLLVLDDTFHVTAHYRPLGFSDSLFQDSVRHGEISYEAGAIISQSKVLTAGQADYVKLDGSDYHRRFVPLISSGVRLGYLICVDTDGHLRKIPEETWDTVEQVLAKQAFIETSRHDKPFETTEDILMHLLDGGFSTAPYFQLQISGTYLADFHPAGFALIDLTGYHKKYIGKRHLKDEIGARFPRSHAFLYHRDVFLFLHGKDDFRDLMMDHRFHGGNVCTVSQLRTPLLLKNVEERNDLIAKEIRILAAHDREKNTQYCETLYHYLTCCRSLKKTCDALFTHRNTVLYRIRRIQDDFNIPLDKPDVHADLLLGVSLILFAEKGPDFFLHPIDYSQTQEPL